MSGHQVAVKIFHDQTATDVICREIDIYTLVQKGFKDLDVKFAPFPRLFWVAERGLRAIALELSQCDLHGEQLQASEVETVAKQLSSALKFLHQTHVHLDVKPGNILWKPLEKQAALADFVSCESLRSPSPLHTCYCTCQ